MLLNELYRFICSSSLPNVLIAQDNDSLFLLTETTLNDVVTTQKKIDETRAIKFITLWADLTISDQQSLRTICNYSRGSTKIDAVFNRILLKIILTPPAALISIVDACLDRKHEKNAIDKLVSRQQALSKYLMKLDSFKQFYLSNDAKNETEKHIEKMKTFRICGERLPLASYTDECIESLHELQRILLVSDPDCFYSLDESDSDLSRELTVPSPSSIALRASPLPIEHAEPLSVPITQLIRKFSNLFVGNVMKNLRGSPVPIYVTNEDEAKERFDGPIL